MHAKFLLLNEAALSELPDVQKPIFILEWLRHVETVLSCISRIELKASQKQLVDQLLLQIQAGPGPPIRNLVAQCMATVFSIGDTITLFDTVNKCNDLLKPLKDDSPSIKLAALACLGCMYSRLGRMMGRSYEETVQVCSKTFRNMESQSRIETLTTFEKICGGMDTACSSSHKDMYKIAKVCLTDRVMAVRTSAAKCILQMMQSAPFLYTTELESLTSLCFRALDGADYDGRIAIAKLLESQFRTRNALQLRGKGIMITSSSSSSKNSSAKPVSLEECLSILMTGFLRGATSFSKGKLSRIFWKSVWESSSRWALPGLRRTWNSSQTTFWNSSPTQSRYQPRRRCLLPKMREFHPPPGFRSSPLRKGAVLSIAGIILKQMNSIDFNPENAKECNQETIFNQHLLVCALQELAALFLSLGTSMYHLVYDPSVSLLNGIFSVLIHPWQSTRLSAAWALRCLCVAIPSETHKTFDTLKTSPEAVSGYSAALSSILGGVRSMPLGIPHATGKIVFNTAEELLRTASQSSRLSIQRSAAGWLMIGAIMTLGNSVVKALLPRMLLLWRNSFPKSAKELESEKARGDAFTWQVTLEGRAGALSSIHSFLLHCPQLLTEEIVQRLMVPIESALAMMTNITSTLKTYGPQLKAAAANLRFRLYQTLTLIKPNYFERSYTHMLRFVIWELTLNDNVANTTTSLFTRVCQSNAIFNSLVSDHVSIEDQLQPTGAAGSGAIEHDPCSLYQELAEFFVFFAGLFSSPPFPPRRGRHRLRYRALRPHISTKHRTQLIDHFVECLKVTKYARKEAVLVNIFCGILMAMRCIRRLGNSSTTVSSSGSSTSTTLNTSFTLSGGEISGQSTSLKSGNGSSSSPPPSSLPSPVIRCAAAEVMGRIAQSVADPRFTSETASFCADKLKISRDVSNRTGHSLALGCLHKYLGGMDSSRHQHGSVSILLNVAQDSSSPETQVWALHSLALVADTGGPLFRSYVEPSLRLVMKLVSTAPLLRVGPELQMAGSSKEIDTMKKSFEIGCALLSRPEEHPLVQNEAITCFQRMHLFGGTINYDVVIPVLFRSMSSTNLLLRRSTVDCFRQLSQREAALVSKYFTKQVQSAPEEKQEEYAYYLESGISGALRDAGFGIRSGIRDTVTSIFSAAATQDKGQLQVCISLCKNILTCDSSARLWGWRWWRGGGSLDASTPPDDSQDFGDDDADALKLNDELSSAGSNRAQNSRWRSRTFAAECLLNLETIIEKFASIRDPDFPSVSILEQFQAQVSAALRPAFAVETDPMVTATACRVSSAWICGNSKGKNIRTKPTLPDFNESANTRKTCNFKSLGASFRHRGGKRVERERLPRPKRRTEPLSSCHLSSPLNYRGREVLSSETRRRTCPTLLQGCLATHPPRFCPPMRQPLPSNWRDSTLCWAGNGGVLRLVIEGMRENFNKIAEKDDDKDPAGTEKELNSEEEATGEELQVSLGNKSVVISRFLSPHAKTPDIKLFQVKSTGTAQEKDKLLGETVASLELLLDICSDAVAIGIQPTVLYLTSCIRREPVAQSDACGAVLRCYKKFVGHRLISNPMIRGEMRGKSICWVLSRSLSRMRRPLGEDWGVLYPSINTFQQAYQSGNEQVRLKAVGLIAQVFEKADRSVSTCFIHALAPRILQFLYGEEAKNVGSKGMLEFILESLRAIQIQVQLVGSSAKRVQMLTLIVPVLINFLVEPQLLGMPMTAHRKLLHDVSLRKLMKIGLQYRETSANLIIDEFRALMGQCTEMRVKLETVIKNSKSLSGNNDKNKTSSGNSTSNSSGGSIKLKTDCSNFTS
ncbi:HEAT repeat-containing protein 5B [Orchesella cincta]|uniref:HEAT repeat-containing protein 5B n=1 Tax=Orchesella cincta TaxID=48709 RepID=A0A1D2MTQ3_ORCCI|nr:HEAT repeat-containing protein 5B [Orchesella cincta]